MSNGSQDEKYDSSSSEEVKIEDNKSLPNRPKRKTISGKKKFIHTKKLLCQAYVG